MTTDTAIHRFVAEARATWKGSPTGRVIARLRSGWAFMGESQLLRGACMLLPDPVVGSLNDLSEPERRLFLEEMALLGDAVAAVCRPPFSETPRRINYEILGNLEPALHAHVIPRFASEPSEYRTKAVWLYPPELWNAPEHRFDERNPVHAQTRAALAGFLAAHPGPRADAPARNQTSTHGSDPLFAKACAFAARAHAGHLRKDNRTPYIAHPFRVAMLVRRLGCDDPVALAAAVLHDTLEDTRTDHDDLSACFGADVAGLVASLSKDKRLPEPARERAYDEQLAAADWRARLIKLCDVLDNADDSDRHAEHPALTADERAERYRRALAIASSERGRHPALDLAAAQIESRLVGKPAPVSHV